MTTYQILIGNTDFQCDEDGNGTIQIAESHLSFDRDNAEELAERWSNKYLGRVHDEVGLLNYIAVREHNAELDTWETLTEFEH